jgi:hypothetical protein
MVSVVDTQIFCQLTVYLQFSLHGVLTGWLNMQIRLYRSVQVRYFNSKLLFYLHHHWSVSSPDRASRFWVLIWKTAMHSAFVLTAKYTCNTWIIKPKTLYLFQVVVKIYFIKRRLWIWTILRSLFSYMLSI